MSADLLDDRVIEVPRVTQELASDTVCVLETLEDVVGNRELRSLSKLGASVLALEMDVLHPAVVLRCQGVGDVLLEHDDVGVRNGLRIGGRKERSSTFMDGFSAECWCR